MRPLVASSGQRSLYGLAVALNNILSSIGMMSFPIKMGNSNNLGVFGGGFVVVLFGFGFGFFLSPQGTYEKTKLLFCFILWIHLHLRSYLKKSDIQYEPTMS